MDVQVNDISREIFLSKGFCDSDYFFVRIIKSICIAGIPGPILEEGAFFQSDLKKLKVYLLPNYLEKSNNPGRHLEQ
jgi:hypothetical protein